MVRKFDIPEIIRTGDVELAGLALHVTHGDKGGKMEGMDSISTSALLNPFCQAMSKAEGSVCSGCYASRYLKGRKALRQHLENNFQLLNGLEIPVEYMPRIRTFQFRIEAFGEVASLVHAKNYARLIKANRRVDFAWWSKRVELVCQALEEEGGKPDNLRLVQSSPMLNQVTAPVHPFVDTVFTVYDSAAAKDVPINCGGTQCCNCPPQLL